MTRILVFGMTENPGGVESFLMTYYRKINRSEIQFDFLCNSYNPIAYEQEILNMGGRTFHFSARSKNPFRYYNELNNFFKNHSHEYNTIWVNVCSLANIDYLIMAKKYGIQKRIIHSHNSQNMDSRLRGILHKRNKKVIDRYATDFWSCSEDASEWFYPERLRSKVVIINNAIDVDKFRFNAEARNRLRKQYGLNDKTVIGNVGRLHFQKNQNFAIEVFAEYQKTDPQSVLVLVGNGEDEVKLKEKAESLGVASQVLFMGVQSNVNDWLCAMDLFLFPSVFEGLGIAALEAQASGVSVLASAEVIPEEVKINSNFVFFDLKKGAAEWAVKMEEIINGFTREEPEVIAARFTAKGFDIKTEVKKLESVLE